MTLSHHDAVQAIRDIETAEARSVTARRYSRGAPHFFLWGVLWIVGYTLCDVAPMQAGKIWAFIVPIGLCVDAYLVRGKSNTARFAAIAATVTIFFFAAFSIFAPVSGRQIAAFIPLVVATSFVLLGIWRGLRYVVAGVAVAALTLGGYFFLSSHFLLWMAAVGGGTFILIGIWLRKV